MLILLPPSEGKTAPADGPPVDLDALSFPALTGPRIDLLATLVRLCDRHPDLAATALGLGPTQLGEVPRNAALPQAPAAPAREVYTGVLYEALGLRELTGPALERADASVVVTSALWGLVRPGDPVPAYRLSGGTTLPGVGGIATFWRPQLRTVLPELADGVLVDLRSSTYASFWRPGPDVAGRVAAVRVLHEHDGRRSVVSHHNKATKGRLARGLLTSGDDPQTPAELADVLRGHGWKVEVTEPDRPGRSSVLDVIVTEVATS